MGAVPILMGIQMGLSLFEGFEQGNVKRQAALDSYYATESAISELNKQKEVLGSIFENLKKPVVDRYGNALLKTTISSDSMKSKSNMAYSGTVSQATGLARDNIKDQFSSEIMNMELNEANQMGAIDSKIKELESQADVYRKQSKYYSPTEKIFKFFGL